MGRRKQRGNGQGTVYKVGETYRAQVTRYENGNRINLSKSGFRTKRDALAWCALHRDDVTEGKQKTFGQVFEEWSAVHFPQITEKKASDYRRVFDCSSRLHDRKIDLLRTGDFQQIIDEQPDKYYSKKLFRTVFSMVSDFAIRNGYISTNYASYVELPVMPKPDKRAFTEDEVRLLWDYYNKHHDLHSGAALIMIYTGMRWGEISTILPENIHLQEGYLRGGIKTDAGRTGDIILIKRIRPIVEDLMLPENKVGMLTAEGFRKGYNKMQSDAGIERHTVHECRHTTATMLAAEGVQPAVISAIMRHTNYSMTMNYTHIQRDEMSVNLDKLK